MPSSNQYLFLATVRTIEVARKRHLNSVIRPRVLSIQAVDTTKFIHPATGEKWYAARLHTRILRVMFRRASEAIQYGRAVVDRYSRKAYIARTGVHHGTNA